MSSKRRRSHLSDSQESSGKRLKQKANVPQPKGDSTSFSPNFYSILQNYLPGDKQSQCEARKIVVETAIKNRVPIIQFLTKCFPIDFKHFMAGLLSENCQTGGVELALAAKALGLQINVCHSEDILEGNLAPCCQLGEGPSVLWVQVRVVKDKTLEFIEMENMEQAQIIELDVAKDEETEISTPRKSPTPAKASFLTALLDHHFLTVLPYKDWPLLHVYSPQFAASKLKHSKFYSKIFLSQVYGENEKPKWTPKKIVEVEDNFRVRLSAISGSVSGVKIYLQIKAPWTKGPEKETDAEASWHRIPETDEIDEILLNAHSLTTLNHVTAKDTIANIRKQHLYWYGVKKMVTEYIQKCQECAKVSTLKASSWKLNSKPVSKSLRQSDLAVKGPGEMMQMCWISLVQKEEKKRFGVYSGIFGFVDVFSQYVTARLFLERSGEELRAMVQEELVEEDRVPKKFLGAPTLVAEGCFSVRSALGKNDNNIDWCAGPPNTARRILRGIKQRVEEQVLMEKPEEDEEGKEVDISETVLTAFEKVVFKFNTSHLPNSRKSPYLLYFEMNSSAIDDDDTETDKIKEEEQEQEEEEEDDDNNNSAELKNTNDNQKQEEQEKEEDKDKDKDEENTE